MNQATLSADIRGRAQQIVAGLTLEQRINLVTGRDFWNTYGIDGTVESFMVSDGPHGLRKQAGDADHVGLSDSVPATCFPVAANLAATWDPGLLEEIGVALGTEARAEDVAILLGPGMNIKRHPRGGRNFEYFSEDPLISGVMASALVRGVQSTGVGACPKHFAVNNQETRRMVIDTIVDERTLREIYLRGFEYVMREEPASIMTAYNQLNSAFCSDSEYLVRDTLRCEWGFDGLVMSDWGGTNDHVAGLAVGMDLEMPGGSNPFAAAIREAITDGRLDEGSLNASAAQVVARALHWSALKASTPAAAPDFDEHHALAKRAAIASMVLLKNEGVLPFTASGNIALVGAFAEQPRYQGAGSSKVNPTRMDSLLDALRSVADVRYAVGYDPTTGASTAEQVADAVQAVQHAERAVLVLGLPARLETEARDRADSEIPSAMNALATAVLAANPRTVIVLMNGGSVTMPWAASAPAILGAGLTGQAGGSAIADVLLGRAEPGGRLAESYPRALSDLPSDANFPGAANQVQYREGWNIGYRFHETQGVPALFPFGHGLGYTTFELGSLQAHASGSEITVTLDITNTGARAGSTVVQVYASAPDSTVPRPAKVLAGFNKVHLPAGASTTMSIELDRRSLQVWDVDTHAWLDEPGSYVLRAGLSVTDLRSECTVHVDRGAHPMVAARPAGPIATTSEFTALLGHEIPTPAPLRPFTRNSTITDLRVTMLGRGLEALMRKGFSRMISEGERASADDLIEAVMEGLPLRGIAQMSPALDFGKLDRIIAVLNGDLPAAMRWKRRTRF